MKTNNIYLAILCSLLFLTSSTHLVADVYAVGGAMYTGAPYTGILLHVPITSNNPDKKYNVCHATLLADNMLLTARHCFDRYLVEDDARTIQLEFKLTTDLFIEYCQMSIDANQLMSGSRSRDIIFLRLDSSQCDFQSTLTSENLAVQLLQTAPVYFLHRQGFHVKKIILEKLAWHQTHIYARLPEKIYAKICTGFSGSALFQDQANERMMVGVLSQATLNILDDTCYAPHKRGHVKVEDVVNYDRNDINSMSTFSLLNGLTFREWGGASHIYRYGGHLSSGCFIGYMFLYFFCIRIRKKNLHRSLLAHRVLSYYR